MTAAVHSRDLPPLGASAFRILLALSQGQRHGYGILREIEAATGGEVRMRFATLYGLLKQMLVDGWIVEAQRAAGDDPRRRCYELTPRGRRVAAAEAERLAELVRTARARHLLLSTELV